MKVLETRVVEECLDGIVIREVLFDGRIGANFIKKLEILGTLEYFPHFPKPFFRVQQSGKYIIKGVEGNETCRIFYVNYSEEIQQLIYRTFQTVSQEGT
ncbi:MAG: hypothetical protein KA957_08815 [Syntrophaceae bacterium]|nr:hypothetical protein [Syntrophaceae bacterium]